ncbi:MAG: hypothetical protein WAN14_02105 [Candidatus Acidiferrales bacterium]
MADTSAPLMSELFRPYEKLVEITILGKTFLVPERNSLLRAFQFISPETVPYGRFCWNQECQYCKVSCQLSDDDQARPILSCKFLVSEGMQISEMAPELVGCLRAKLGAAAQNNPKPAAPSATAAPATNTDNVERDHK